MSEKNVATAVAYYQAMNNKDLSALEKLGFDVASHLTPFNFVNLNKMVIPQRKSNETSYVFYATSPKETV